MFRPSIDPTANNGLRIRSTLMAEKITTVPKSKIGDHVGYLDDIDVERLDKAIRLFLGLL